MYVTEGGGVAVEGERGGLSGVVKRGRFSVMLRLGAIPLQLIVLAALARILGERGLGVYFLIMSTGTVVARFAGLGLNQSIIRLVAEGRDVADVGMRPLFVKVGILSVAMAALVALAFGLWGGTFFGQTVFESPEYVELSAIIALWLFFFTLQGLVSGVFEAFGKVHWTTFFMPGGMFRQIAIVMFVAAGLFLGVTFNIYTLTSFMVIVSFAAVVLSLFVINNTPAVAPGEDKFSVRYILSTSWPLMITAFGIGISREIDTWVLGAVGTESELGVYRASARLAEAALLIEGMLAVVLRPYMAELIVGKNLDKLGRLASVYVMFLLALSVPLLAATIFWGHELLELMFGSGFGDGALPMVVRLAGFVVLFGLGPVVALLQVSRHSAYLVRSMGIGLPIQALLTYFGAVAWGAAGTAFGWVLGMIITRIIMVAFCIQKVGVNPTLELSLRTIHDGWNIALEVVGRRYR